MKIRWLCFGGIAVLVGLVVFAGSAILADQVVQVYTDRGSVILIDRKGAVVSVVPNEDGYYAPYSDDMPDRFKDLVLEQEDRYFYLHPGFNPFSILRAASRKFVAGGNPASSTITQQLIKILFSSELDRSFKNKMVELLYAVSLELHWSKKDILEMYLNSVYFGNSVQGLTAASQLYFGESPPALSNQEMIRLIATISSPSTANPFMAENIRRSHDIAARLGAVFDGEEFTIYEIRDKTEAFSGYVSSVNYFEVGTVANRCDLGDRFTIDSELTVQIRSIVKRTLQTLAVKNATDAAVVVLKEPENEILSLVGSPDPLFPGAGYQINMAVAPRPVGSTMKPLIYVKGFEKGLRPYTMVDDKEYYYTIGSGYAFYPKNYDYEYRGPVTLHYALSNSLNVPTVKVLEYVGLENFYEFLDQGLELTPAQPLENYQLGIALGVLEADLLTLSYYFSLFSNNGHLRPLAICPGEPVAYRSHTNFQQDKQIVDPPYAELVNRILTDRQTGVEQFGMKSNLNVFNEQVAVKTGTSREYHDSWAIGYTPDFVVGVWVGNTENTAMDAISGESGAGRIWNEVMQLLLNSEYNRHSEFSFDALRETQVGSSLEFGLAGDDVSRARGLMTEETLITHPHDQDAFLFESLMRIPLRSDATVIWEVNGAPVGRGSEIFFEPPGSGTYAVRAMTDDGQTESVTFKVNESE